MKTITFAILLAVTSFISVAQTAPEEALRTKWNAQWITHPSAPLREPGVFHFRKVLTLPSTPQHFVVHVSADNRFVLFVNAKRVGDGPARGDFYHWRYQTFDLANYLKPGDNVIAVTVWQYGIYAPLAQISDRMAFLLEGDNESESVVNTNSTWEIEQEFGHTVKRPMPDGMYQYWAAGPGERIDAKNYDWEWQRTGNSPNSHWIHAVPAIREAITPEGASKPVNRIEDAGTKWLLVSNELPPMEYTEVASGKVVRTELKDDGGFPAASTVVPANSSATVLIDHGTVLSAYPELEVSGGRDALIQMSYTEALYDAKQERGNRNEVKDRVVIGLTDEFLPDGAAHRLFRPLWWRTWRFLELKIKTGGEPLTLKTLRTYYTAYPFQERGTFVASDPDLARIREICWRTARLDAHETYMDTAYWEQLQYIGDTRIQALISYAVSGDDRLARQALQAFDDSRIPEGITQSRYPSSLAQFIPPFSLLYVNMLHDYWMYRRDKIFVAKLLPGTRAVLAWFLEKQRPDGMLSSLPGWIFIDWVQGNDKFPPKDAEGRSAVVTLQFAAALRAAADLEEALGDPQFATQYRQHAQLAAEGVYKLCWDARLGLLADTPEKNSYSQHANIAAVSLDVIPKADQKTVLQRVLGVEAGQAPSMTKASYFYQFYVARALEHAGLQDRYIDVLRQWRDMLAKGLTTTPESPDPTRSDTHAWSAHPAFDLPTIIAGIHPAAPGFASVRIDPALADLRWVKASMPHPNGGIIEVSYERTAKGTHARISLPGSLQGVLLWKGKSYALKSGPQEFLLPD